MESKIGEIEACLAEVKENQAELKNLIKNVKKELRGLIEIQQRLIHERLGVTPPAPPKEYGEDPGKKVKNIEIINYTPGRIGVVGNTYDYNSAIKSAASDNDERAKWDPAPSKVWHMSEKCLGSLIENLRALDLEEGTDFVVSAKPEEKPDEEKPEKEGFGSGFVIE